MLSRLHSQSMGIRWRISHADSLHYRHVDDIISYKYHGLQAIVFVRQPRLNGTQLVTAAGNRHVKLELLYPHIQRGTGFARHNTHLQAIFLQQGDGHAVFGIKALECFTLWAYPQGAIRKDTVDIK